MTSEERKAYNKEYHQKNPDKKKEYYAKNAEKLKEQMKEYGKAYYQKNAEQNKEYYAKNAEKIKEYNKAYNAKNAEKRKANYAKNAEKLKASRKKKTLENPGHHYQTKLKRFEIDPDYKLMEYIRNVVLSAYSRFGFKKTSHTGQILQCDGAFFKAWIEFQFDDKINWDTKYLWHYDHFIPLASDPTPEGVTRLNNWSNIRPLDAIENMRKSDSMPSPAEIAEHQRKVDLFLSIRLEQVA